MGILGLIAGFSPTLYIAQIGIASSSKRARSLMVALMIGVLTGIIALSIVFQFFQLETLRLIIDSTLSAFFVSIIFNTMLGTAFIIAGFWYINKKPNRIHEEKIPNSKSSFWALVSLGFFRTFVSISGATATFIASGILSSANSHPVSWVILAIIFLATTIAPFVLILVTMGRHPDKIQNVLEWLKTQLYRFNYRLVIGVAAIIVGSAIILFNVLRVVVF